MEYTAHPDAHFHLSFGRFNPFKLPVIDVELKDMATLMQLHPRMRLRPDRHSASETARHHCGLLTEQGGKPVAVKLHIHGLRMNTWLLLTGTASLIQRGSKITVRILFIRAHTNAHIYLGKQLLIYPWVKSTSKYRKGLKSVPFGKIVNISAETKEIIIEIDSVLHWREKGWVTADTHVHFLSPMTALLEGAAEGVNVVNLLASQWGELMTNVGDFDGTNTWGTNETGGDGEYLVRVGTENRQHILGHISLLGYSGKSLHR